MNQILKENAEIARLYKKLSPNYMLCTKDNF